MHEELEATLRELEAKLPDLRHLIADSGVVLTTSSTALVLAARLLRAITAADEVASLLRLTLLNGGELVVPTAPDVPAAPIPEPPPVNAAEISATGSGLTDSDYALKEALGLLPSTSTSFDEAIGELDATGEELEQSADTLAPSNTEESVASFIEDLSDETLDTIEKVLETEDRWNRELEELRTQTSEALDEKNLEKARHLVDKQRRLERALSRLSQFPERPQNIVSELAEKLGMQPPAPEPSLNTREVLGEAFRLTGHRSLETFEEIRKEYIAPLEEAVYSYLRNEREAKKVTERMMAHGERVWNAAEGEISVLELLASLAVQQIELLLPRPEGEAERIVPTPRQIFRYLARHRVERLIDDIEHRLDRLRIGIQESIGDVLDSVRQEIATLEQLRDEVMRQFYNGLLRLDNEDDNGEGDAMGARITPPPPIRGPGATRTFDEALAFARNP